MALLGWLFGKSRGKVDDQVRASAGTSSVRFTTAPQVDRAPSRPDQWDLSEAGNLTITMGTKRLTVFESDGGWKFCVAAADREDNDPYFSELYSSSEAARDEAVALISGNPSKHVSITQARRDDRRERWIETINERAALIDSIDAELRENPEMKITALRKPEAKLASQIKQLQWQPTEYRAAGVPESLVATTLALEPRVRRLADEVSSRIEKLQSKRPTPKPKVTDSRLTEEQKESVDSLVTFISRTDTISEAEIEKRRKRSFREAFSRLSDGSMNYGEASGFPVKFLSDEKEHREFMKIKDQDLLWQCEITRSLFERHLEMGEMPAPHYPRRICVLLRKAHDFDGEEAFLGAWRKHFTI